MSNREGAALLCISAALLLIGYFGDIAFAAWLGVFAAVLGFAALAWNLVAEDSAERDRRRDK